MVGGYSRTLDGLVGGLTWLETWLPAVWQLAASSLVSPFARRGLRVEFGARASSVVPSWLLWPSETPFVTEVAWEVVADLVAADSAGKGPFFSCCTPTCASQSTLCACDGTCQLCKQAKSFLGCNRDHCLRGCTAEGAIAKQAGTAQNNGAVPPTFVRRAVLEQMLWHSSRPCSRRLMRLCWKAPSDLRS